MKRWTKRTERNPAARLRIVVGLCVLVVGCAHGAADPMDPKVGGASAGGAHHGSKVEEGEGKGLSGPAPRISGGTSPALGVPTPEQTLLDEAWKEARRLEKGNKPKAAAKLLEKVAKKMKGRVAVELQGEIYRLYLEARWLERALLALDRMARLTTRKHERVFAAERMEHLSKRLAGTRRAVSLYALAKAGTLFKGALAPSVAAYYRANGRLQKAKKTMDDAAAERKKLRALRGSASVGSRHRIAVVVSFSGAYRGLSRSVLQGVLLASDVYGGSGRRRSLEVKVVDAASIQTPTRALEQGKFGHGVLAALGPINPKKAKLLAVGAEKVGFPLVTLTPESTVVKNKSQVFRYLPRNTLRAQALAQAMKKRLSPGDKIGVISPSNAAGKKMVQAFKDTLANSKIEVTVETTYALKATHFSKQVKKLVKARVQGIFVVAGAGTLQLLAPQLALGGLWAGTPTAKASRGRRRRKRRRRVLLAATADGMTPGRLKRTSRYLQGALLCPGFFPLRSDSRWGEFLRGFKRAYGKDPNIISAYAYEATVTLRRVLEAGGRGKGSASQRVATGLKALKAAGGGKVFDSEGDLAVQPGIFEVLGVTVRRVK